MIPAKIKWGPIICNDCETCICSTRIQYREQGDTVWITPTLDNPTQETEYTITVERGIRYEVLLTFIGPQCNSKSVPILIYLPNDTCCPTGYVPSPDGQYCYYIQDVAAIPPSGTPDTLVASSNVAYSTCGSYIYDLGFNINGTGPSSQITTANTFWSNGAGACVDNTTVDGPLNRSGVWVSPAVSNQDIGFGVCLQLSESKTYYIGIAADNYGIIKVDGNTIVTQDSTALDSQYGIGGAAFKVWHIYPVVLSAGPHILELIGHNNSAAAAIGCEVYSATAAELIAATSYASLGGKLIFSSKDYVGEEAQLGTQDAGYTCPAGYSIAPCEDPIVCRRIVTTPTVDC